MKKKFLTSLLILMSITTTLTFTSCNKDDDGFDSEESSEHRFGYKYVEPFLQWGATKDEIASYMSTGSDWTFVSEGSTDKAFNYQRSNPLTEITYYVNPVTDIKGLYQVTVHYYSNKDSELQDLKSRVEDSYHCQLQRVTDSSNLMYEAEDVIINGKKTSITILSLTTAGIGTMTVMYLLDV